MNTLVLAWIATVFAAEDGTRRVTDEEYKYDVAFSFLAEDESLATELNDLLQDRLSTFLYSKRQEEIAGSDGEKAFSRVFGQESRSVVVLYRSGWGETSWTRIEQTAIRNRAFEEGYDFALFIPLDRSGVPKWVPKSQLWIGLDRWGKTAAASVIEARVQSLGGSPKQETVEERAKRLERALRFDQTKKQFRQSHDGVNKSDSEFELVCDEIVRLVQSIGESVESINYSAKRSRRLFVVLGPHAGMSVTWHCFYANSLDKAELEAALWLGHPPFPGLMHVFEEPKKRKTLKFDFDLLNPDKCGWRLRSEPKTDFDSNGLATFLMKWFMDDAQPN